MSENVTASVIPMRQRVAEEIRALLARRSMSGSELARRVGVTQPYMSRRLTGEIAFDVDDLQAIAEVLDVQPSDLLAAVGTATIREPTSRRRDRRSRHADVAVAAVTHPSARSSNARTSTGRPPSYPAQKRRPIILAQPDQPAA